MKDKIFEILICPDCKSDLELISSNFFCCKVCSQSYPIKFGSINFLSEEAETSGIHNVSSKNNFDGLLRKLFMAIKTSHTFKTQKSKNRISSLINALEVNEFSIKI